MRKALLAGFIGISLLGFAGAASAQPVLVCDDDNDNCREVIREPRYREPEYRPRYFRSEYRTRDYDDQGYRSYRHRRPFRFMTRTCGVIARGDNFSLNCER